MYIIASFPDRSFPYYTFPNNTFPEALSGVNILYTEVFEFTVEMPTVIEFTVEMSTVIEMTTYAELSEVL